MVWWQHILDDSRLNDTIERWYGMLLWKRKPAVTRTISLSAMSPWSHKGKKG